MNEAELRRELAELVDKWTKEAKRFAKDEHGLNSPGIADGLYRAAEELEELLRGEQAT